MKPKEILRPTLYERWKVTSVGEDKEKLELSYMAGRNAESFQAATLESSLAVSKKAKSILNI